MWFSTVFPIHRSTLDCQVPSINNNWNNPDLWISVFCAQCYWPVVKILLSFDWCKKRKKHHSDKDLAFLVKLYKGKDSVIEIVKRFLHGVHKCNVWYLFDKYTRMMNNPGWSFVKGGGDVKNLRGICGALWPNWSLEIRVLTNL